MDLKYYYLISIIISITVSAVDLSNYGSWDELFRQGSSFLPTVLSFSSFFVVSSCLVSSLLIPEGLCRFLVTQLLFSKCLGLGPKEARFRSGEVMFQSFILVLLNNFTIVLFCGCICHKS